MSKTVNLSQEALEVAKQALKTLPDSKLHFRLLAIVKAAEKGAGVVAEFFDISRNSISNWIKRFAEGGVEGLVDKPKGHNPSKLSPEHLHQIEHWIETKTNSKNEEVHWTLNKLRIQILEQWNISIGITPLWGHLQRLGYRHKSVRPRHTNQPDEETLEAFKKNLCRGRSFFERRR